MAFGSIMTIPDGARTITLAPFSKEESLELISPGMQQLRVTKYFSKKAAPVAQDEYDWYEAIRTSSTKIVWGIWLDEGNGRELIGTTNLIEIDRRYTNRAASGVQICKPEYWGKGIVSLAHKARTWYAFEQLGLHCISSQVVCGNDASLKALERVGYVRVSQSRNLEFVDGSLQHVDNLELLNPTEWSWQLWWQQDTPSDELLQARERTREVIEWGYKHLVV